MTLSIFLFSSSSVLIPILVGTHYLLNLLMYNTCMDLQARFRYVLRYTHFHVPLSMFASRGSGLVCASLRMCLCKMQIRPCRVSA